MKEFAKIKHEMEKIYDFSDWDQEVAHMQADELLCKVAINPELTIEQKSEIVDIYKSIPKWYA